MKKEGGDARLLDRCEAWRKEWAKHWQCDESVQNMEDKPWENQVLKKEEEALPRLKEREQARKSVEIVQGENGSRMRRLPHQSSLGNKRRSGVILGKGGTKWKMAAASLHDECSS